MKHLVGIQDLSDDDIRAILKRSARMEREMLDSHEVLDDRIICTAFFEPSTRTRLSFEAAAHRLGANVIGFSDPASTSTSKGETLEDTTRILSGYCDLIVLRHPKEGAAARAAKVSPVPIVNAGDGPGEHPTQTLLDLYTIEKEKGRIKGVRVGLVGDLLNGRTVHSLVPALKRLGAIPVAVAAPGLELPSNLGAGVEKASLDEAARSCDVLYVTRVQKERFLTPAAYEAVKGSFLIDLKLLERNHSQAIVLHPLPRVDEIHDEMDSSPAAKYFDQARNGLPVRMAVLAHLLEKAR
jgi:aspartate carbamoyltransferase catalytic subunit